MHHRSKANVAKLEKINIINIIKGVKLIKFIYTCRSIVEKTKPSLDKSYTITNKKYYDNFDLKRFYIHH